MSFAVRSLKSQMKQADKLGAAYVLIVGEAELATGRAILRNMETKVQQELPLESLVEKIRDALVTVNERT